MAQINNNLIPLVIGDNLNDIILDFKYNGYNKICTNIKKQKNYYLTVIEEINNIDIVNKMNKIIDELTNLIVMIDYKLNEIEEVKNNI